MEGGGDYVTTGTFYVAVLKFRPLADTFSSLWNECRQLPAVSACPSVLTPVTAPFITFGIEEFYEKVSLGGGGAFYFCQRTI